jgi:hypothetical protein
MEGRDGVLHPRASLVAHLHEATVLPRRGDEHFRLPRILAAGLFNVDVLARLERQQGCRRVPVIRQGEEDGVERLVIERRTEILHALRRRRTRCRHGLHGQRQPLWIDLCKVGDLDPGNLEERLDVAHAAAEAHDRDADRLSRLRTLHASRHVPGCRGDASRRDGCQKRTSSDPNRPQGMGLVRARVDRGLGP